MPTPIKPTPSRAAILLLAEMKAAVEAFDLGDANVFDAIDTIVVAVEAYRAAAKPKRKAA